MQTDAQETRIQEKDSEVLRLLNQIATDMIRKSDVDRLIEEAVAKATAALKADYYDTYLSLVIPLVIPTVPCHT